MKQATRAVRSDDERRPPCFRTRSTWEPEPLCQEVVQQEMKPGEYQSSSLERIGKAKEPHSAGIRGKVCFQVLFYENEPVFRVCFAKQCYIFSCFANSRAPPCAFCY